MSSSVAQPKQLPTKNLRRIGSDTPKRHWKRVRSSFLTWRFAAAHRFLGIWRAIFALAEIAASRCCGLN